LRRDQPLSDRFLKDVRLRAKDCEMPAVFLSIGTKEAERI
jgi:hypothetical protein